MLPFRNARFALITGFGGLLLAMTLAGTDALLALRQIRREDNTIRSEFLFRNRTLNEIRSDLYLSGTYVRDYLLEPEPVRAATFRSSLEDVRKRMQSAMDAYRGQLRPDERTQYAALTSEISRYWNTLLPVLQWDSAERHAQGYIFLRDDVFPRRAAMLDVASRIADLNEQQMNAGNERVAGLLVRFQTRLTATLLTALLLGLGVAAFSTRHILRLEADSQLRYQETAEAREQLTNLSAKLVHAQEAERRALSTELHDEVGQALSAVLVELKNLSLRLGPQSPEASLNVETIKKLVEGTVRVVRNMALLLRPSMLDDLGLIPALRWQAREMSKRTGIDVSVATELASDNLPEEFKTCLYRVVQEALHNCEVHSGASSVRIRVHQEHFSQGADRIILRIQDDGRGFNTAQTKGLGLLGIEERAARLGGVSEVYSQVGGGAILTVELPLTGAAAGAVGRVIEGAEPERVSR